MTSPPRDDRVDLERNKLCLGPLLRIDSERESIEVSGRELKWPIGTQKNVHAGKKIEEKVGALVAIEPNPR